MKVSLTHCHNSQVVYIFNTTEIDLKAEIRPGSSGGDGGG